MTTNEIFALYFDTEPMIIKKLELTRGDDDFREVYIVEDGCKKLVIKHVSNTFTDGNRINACARLIEEYNRLGIYSPHYVKSKNGRFDEKYTSDKRDYYIWAEEFAQYETAEHLGDEKMKDSNGAEIYLDDMFRALGKVASAHYNFMAWGSAYCLLEPFCPPDTVDEQTECAEKFFDYINENLSEFKDEVNELKKIFYQNKDELSKIYPSLPISCFQADLNDSNVLIDTNNRFAGLIDFNLAGREPVLNYVCREALWNVSDNSFDDEHKEYYDTALDDKRISIFLHNMRMISETYDFSDEEREAFSILFRYINSIWWMQISEIKAVHDDSDKVKALLNWVRRQMTRDDIRLPI